MADRIGYCALCADILHIGHIRFLIECKSKCDRLIVGLMTDGCILDYKGSLPIMKYGDRQALLLAIKYVDDVIPQCTFEFSPYVNQMADIIFDSSQHKRKGATEIIEYTKGISSTKIKEKIIEAHNSKCKAKRGVKRK